MNLYSLLITAIVAAVFASTEAASIGHDKVQPFPQPEPVTESEKVAVKFKPGLRISGVCHPYPAVNAAGETSGGLKGTGKLDGDCKGSGLGSQVYGRAAWHKGMWAIMYAWYFPKERGYGLFAKGRRHKWTAAVVWLDNPALENPKILAVSAIGVNGVYDITKNGPPVCGRWSCAPPFVDHIDGTSPMLVFAPSYDVCGLELTTNRAGREYQDLIMWEQLTEEARTALTEAEFAAPFIDEAFIPNLESARPFL